MPELAEVEITRQQLLSWWSSRAAMTTLVHDEALLKDDATRVSWFEQPLLDVKRRGKYLCLCFGPEKFVMLHLRMTGKIVRTPHAKTKAARISWQLDDEEWVHFEDSRRLGTLSLHEQDPWTTHPSITAMGPEPHDLERGEQLSARWGGTKRRLKDVLLDQKVVAGVGNIAISELFFELGLPPKVRAHEVSAAKVDALVKAMPPYFDAIIDAQPLDVPMDYVNQNNAENPFVVYAREHEMCPRCLDDTIARETFGGRSTYYCPSCQKS